MAKLKLPLPKEIMDKLLDAMENGLTYERACLISGIPQATFYTWKQKGEQAESGKYKEFVELLKKAQAHGVLSRVKRIRKHADKDWKADAWYLERNYPEQYAKREYTENKNVDKSEMDEIYRRAQDEPHILEALIELQRRLDASKGDASGSGQDGQ